QGSDFQVILRQSSLNHLDFSVILAVCPRETNLSFRLRRYNGKSHEHTNRIEGTKFFDFHVHTATERYQDLGVKEDSFAEPTERFSDLSSALNCMFQECAFDVPGDDQPSLFQELE
ncbi:MAG TPA: hypothetical protein PK395_14280, partial [bacterium]|nr:hypothetical protein [bacterium]